MDQREDMEELDYREEDFDLEGEHLEIFFLNH